MRTADLVGTAVASTFRSKMRTTLTVLAIFVGAFTLTITNGLGTGINQYISSTVASFGSSDVMTVTKTAPNTSTTSTDSGPQKYDPNSVSSGRGGFGGTTQLMTDDDISTLEGIDGVTKVKPVRSIDADYVQAGDGTKYVASIGAFITGQTVQLAAGSQPDNSTSAHQVVIPKSYVKPLGFSSNDDAIGQTVTLALTDNEHHQQTVTATVVGVSEQTFAGADNFTPNDALTTKLYDLQSVGLPAAQQNRYAQASVSFASGSTDAQITALKHRLTDAGFTGTTTADQLGSFTTVINGIVLVLNAFAILALIVAAFGIVNTLLMSVQERTREIGLMKAMGMGSGRVFGLFSLEATFIGFLGSAIGALVAILVGTLASGALSTSLLSDLPGLQLIAFDPVSIVTTILIIMAIAFLAGSLPAIRAARKDPVEALRYE